MTKKLLLGGVGVGLLLAGVAWTFKHWLYVTIVFGGVLGPVLAVAGLVLLTMLRD